MSGLARCVICEREQAFATVPPQRCRKREGGCGTAKGMAIVRWPGTTARRYDPDGENRAMVERVRRLLVRQAARRR